MAIRVTIWNEFREEKMLPEIAAVYPDGIHNELKRQLAADDLEITTATLDEPSHGLTEEVLNSTDVLLWWGHWYHNEVDDNIVAAVCKRVLEGMGLIVLHSGHYSKVFQRILGTSCSLKWREADEKERIWNIAPTHPIAAGIDEYFEIPHEEMYGERFDIPDDGKVIFLGWFKGGNVFRSGVAFERGYGKIFYFQPGHESRPVYRDKNVVRVISNAVRWAKPVFFKEMTAPKYPALEDLDK
jgi:trehalose utilization protein